MGTFHLLARLRIAKCSITLANGIYCVPPVDLFLFLSRFSRRGRRRPFQLNLGLISGAKQSHDSGMGRKLDHVLWTHYKYM